MANTRYCNTLRIVGYSEIRKHNIRCCKSWSDVQRHHEESVHSHGTLKMSNAKGSPELNSDMNDVFDQLMFLTDNHRFLNADTKSS